MWLNKERQKTKEITKRHLYSVIGIEPPMWRDYPRPSTSDARFILALSHFVLYTGQFHCFCSSNQTVWLIQAGHLFFALARLNKYFKRMLPRDSKKISYLMGMLRMPLEIFLPKPTNNIYITRNKIENSYNID